MPAPHSTSGRLPSGGTALFAIVVPPTRRSFWRPRPTPPTTARQGEVRMIEGSERLSTRVREHRVDRIDHRVSYLYRGKPDHGGLTVPVRDGEPPGRLPDGECPAVDRLHLLVSQRTGLDRALHNVPADE